MEEFREQLVKLFNECSLPFDAKFYILKDVFRDVDEVYRNQLQKLNKERGSEQT